MVFRVKLTINNGLVNGLVPGGKADKLCVNWSIALHKNTNNPGISNMGMSIVVILKQFPKCNDW